MECQRNGSGVIITLADWLAKGTGERGKEEIVYRSRGDERGRNDDVDATATVQCMRAALANATASSSAPFMSVSGLK